jgi:hypothetical protein
MVTSVIDEKIEEAIRGCVRARGWVRACMCAC